jgi:hypothetical protein
MPMTRPSRRVFINCPFDAAHKPIVDALLFTVYDCGFAPSSALEEADSGEVRFSKLMRLIRDCRLGIHDISRTELTELDVVNGLPRFNMPFELGLFLRCRYANAKKDASKFYLVLDRGPYRFQKFLSDIAGQDIRSHDSPFVAIGCVRDWLRTAFVSTSFLGPDEIVCRYEHFKNDLPELSEALRLTPDRLIFADMCHLVSIWLTRVASIPQIIPNRTTS